MTPVETLRSELHPDGKIHARYPTAELTLCGRRVLAGGSSSGLPDCGVCSRTARLFDRVDGSMPDRWRAGPRRWTPPPPVEIVRVPKIRQPNIPTVRIVASLQAVAIEMGRPPTSYEWDARSPSRRTIYHRFGSWDAALTAAGLA
jgi:hypothetical protein